MNTIIKTSLKDSMSYQEYKDLVEQKVDEKSTTGAQVTEALAEYTKLNDRRIKRWDKTVKVPENIQKNAAAFKGNHTWIVLTESWCGDAAHIMPVINKIAEFNDNIDYRVVLRDDHEELMDQFLTNGGRAIPKLVMIDNDTDEVVGTFGPRPSEATQMVNDYKAEHGKVTAEFKEDLQRWYNKNKGQNILEDLNGMLCELQPATCL